MGIIRTYNHEQNIFDRKPNLSQDALDVWSLNAGQYWSKPHDCGTYGNQCKEYQRLLGAANRRFGTGNYTSTHRDGLMGILRKL